MKNKKVEFNIGDKVVAKGGWGGGVKYKVITNKQDSQISPSSYFYNIEHSRFPWYWDDIELYKEEEEEEKKLELYKEEEKEMRFNIGDKVKKSDGTGFEKTLLLYSTIIGVAIKDDNSYRYKVEDSKISYKYGELILEQRDMPQEQKEVEFNIGDKVILKYSGAWKNGDKYKTITRKDKVKTSPNNYLYKYGVEGSDADWYCDEIELYKEQQKEIEFNVGDRVVFKEVGVLSKGRKYLVIASKMESKSKEYKYDYKFKDLSHPYYYDELELYKEEEKEIEFNIGDKVISKGCGALSDGCEYTVITKKGESTLEEYKYYYKIKGASYYYHCDELELYKENNKTTLTDFSTKELNEKLKTLEKEREEINKAIREKKKMEEEEKEKNDLKVALKTIIKRMEELGMNVSELIKD